MSVEVFSLGGVKTDTLDGKVMKILGAYYAATGAATLTFNLGGSGYTVPANKKFRIVELTFTGTHPDTPYGYFDIYYGSTQIASTIPLRYPVSITAPLIFDVPAGNSIIAYARAPVSNYCYHSAILVGYEVDA